MFGGKKSKNRSKKKNQPTNQEKKTGREPGPDFIQGRARHKVKTTDPETWTPSQEPQTRTEGDGEGARCQYVTR